jgi:hypothetical protein
MLANGYATQPPLAAYQHTPPPFFNQIGQFVASTNSGGARAPTAAMMHSSQSAPNLNPLPPPPNNQMPFATAFANQQRYTPRLASIDAEPTSSQQDIGGNGGQMRYLYNAYRVGMLALELLGKKIDEDRSYVNKYSQVNQCTQ